MGEALNHGQRFSFCRAHRYPLLVDFLACARAIFLPGIFLSGIFLGSGVEAVYESRVMTRSSIELAVQVFLVSLVIVFAWAFYKVMLLVGWL